MAKIVSAECPKCGTQSRIPVGAVDVDTREVVIPTCPACGFEFEY